MTQHALTIGVVGLGFGRAHIPAFQANGCRVVAVCQRDVVGAKAVADRYGVPHVFERWEEMLERAKPELVVIATPPHLHRAIAVSALASGAHVLCEKPLAMTRADAEAMMDAGRRGLLHRARRAGLRRAGDVDREPRRARGERAHARGVRDARRDELSPGSRQRALVGGRATPDLRRRPRARGAPHRTAAAGR